MNTLIIVRGLPGSGKTTIAEYLSEETGRIPYPVYSADDYFMVDGEYKFDAEKLGAAHGSCKYNTEQALIANVPKVFVANTFTTEKEIKPYQELAQQYGYRFVSLIVENRHGNSSVHNVPDETMEKMKNRFTVKL